MKDRVDRARAISGLATLSSRGSMTGNGCILLFMGLALLFGSPTLTEPLTAGTAPAQMPESVAAHPGEPGGRPPDKPSVLDKLMNSEYIIEPLEQGEETVKVIVNLIEPERLRRTASQSAELLLDERQYEVAAAETSVLSALAPEDFQVRHIFENQASFSGEVTAQGLAQLLGDPRVESIQPDYLMERHTAQGIPLMNATLSRQSYNGQDVAIAIIDDGFDYTHPRLGGGSFPNSKVIDGYDFGENDGDPAPGDGNLNFHGTLCAGVAVGNIGNRGDYIGGVAYGAKLYALKISDADGNIYSSMAARAVDWCVSNKNKNPQHPILVISTSVGYGRYYDRASADNANPNFARAVNNAIAAGITVMASSGNEGYCESIQSPAALTGVISVGSVYDAGFASSHYPCVEVESCVAKEPHSSCPSGYYAIDHPQADLVPSYSSTASFLDILAPADSAHTLDVVGLQGLATGDYYSEFGGTSAACPYAAGAVACLQSASKAITGGYLSPADVKNVLTSTGDNVTDTKPTPNIAKPRINLGRAINSIRNVSVIEFTSTDVPKTISDNATITSALVVPDVDNVIDFDVKLDITHTYDSDLDVYLGLPLPPLSPPLGERRIWMELFTDVGSSGNDFRDTILDDDAPRSITEGSAPFTGSYRPEGQFLFPAHGVAGTWTLEITDDAGGDVGTLTSWSLIVEVGENPCPTVISSYPYQEGFESGFGNWVNVTDSDDIDWRRHSGPTDSSNTGPSSAHTGSHYLYIEATGRGDGYPNKTAILESSCFNIVSPPDEGPFHVRIATVFVLSFSYHMYGATMGTLIVEVSEDNGNSWTQVWSKSGDQGSLWEDVEIGLYAYRGKTIKLRFKGITGSSYTSDIAIDTIAIYETASQLSLDIDN